MKNIHRIIALLSVFAVAFSLIGCSGKKTKTALAAYEDWFFNRFEPAYAAFIASGKAQNVPSSDLSLLIASDDYAKQVFAFIKDGTKPAAGEITEKDGVYTYTYGTFDQVFEFSPEKTAMKITMHQFSDSQSYVDFIACFAQEGSHFYLQYLSPDFQDYAEVRFTEKNGRSMRSGDRSSLPYDIFSSDIPSGFAKENETK